MFRIKDLAYRTRIRLRAIPMVYFLYRTLKNVFIAYRTGSWRFVNSYAPGHYYSPIPNFREVSSRPPAGFEEGTHVSASVDLNEDAQLDLLDRFSHYYKQLPFSTAPNGNTRYYYENTWFRHADAITLYCVLRHCKPSRVVEVGSGFSSAVMLDTNDLFLQNKAQFTFVDPYPQRLSQLLTQKDKEEHTILAKQVQDVPLAVFHTLSANDILFMDSSHVVKSESDISYLLFKVLPELSPGVIIHVHDVFWPFEYPKEWFLLGRAWNEVYFLHAFLQFNSTFKVMYFNSFVEKQHRGALQEKMPLCLESHGSSIWIKKVA